MIWPPPKCTILAPTSLVLTDETFRPRKDGLRVTTQTPYLGITATWEELGQEVSISRIKKAAMKADMLITAGIDDGNFNSADMIKVYQSFLHTKATYSLHLVPKNSKTREA